MLLSILGFLAVLGPLVVFHEFGHYIFARIFGVKAEVFSIGFGPRIWSHQFGETEVRISIVPLGGFVKLLGEDPSGETELPPELKKRSLQVQPPWKRFFIFFGGPLFNFILAILIFMAILVIGEPQLSSVAGRVVQGSAAEKAGFRSGDKIIAIENHPIVKFEDIFLKINESPGKPVDFTVVHEGNSQPVQLRVTPSPQEGYSVYGESTNVGEIDGLIATSRATQIGISDPQSPVGKLGEKTGEKITAWNGKPITTWEEIEKLYPAQPAGSEIRLQIENSKKESHKITLTKPASSTQSLGRDLGIYSSELFVDKAVAKSPADVAGIKSGDRLVGIGTQDVQSFFELKDAVQRAGEHDGKVMVRWERDGKMMSSLITPNATSGRDPSLKKTTQYTVGVMPLLSWAEPITFIERTWNPFVLVYKATERMVVFSYRNVISLGKMFTGEVSPNTLGGPILIGKIAGESISRGLIAFLTTMAILSVGLGVLNIMPIPVLDGGHLLLLGIEAIRGRPLSVRQTEVIQQIGLSLILLLMVFVIRNDLARLPFFE